MRWSFLRVRILVARSVSWFRTPPTHPCFSESPDPISKPNFLSIHHTGGVSYLVPGKCSDIMMQLPKMASAPTNPVPSCPSCGQTMTRFTARETGRPYIKCSECDVLLSERDPRIPSCKCGLTAKLRTSKTSNNPGRKFRGCGKLVSATDRCDFFVWE